MTAPVTAARCPSCGRTQFPPGSHPLTRARAALGWSQPRLAREVARALAAGGGPKLAMERQKVWRWEHRGVVPEEPARVAIAHLFSVPAHATVARPWPEWLESSPLLAEACS